jgi:MFS family permease
MGVSSMLVMAGTISGPLVAGILADRTGDFRLGFTILAILSGIGSVFFLLARRPTARTREVEAGPPAAPVEARSR